MRDYKILKGLQPLCFQHPMDRSLLRRMESLPGVPYAVGKLVDYIVKQEKLAFYSGDAFVVSEKSMPELYTRFTSVCRTLNISEPFPQLFVKGDGAINAYTTGTDNQMIVCLNRGVASFCSDGEQRFILGHELGHCLCEHVLYHNVARFFTKGLELTELFTSAVTLPLQILRPLLMEWSRCSELSADRAGLLACQDLSVACSAFAKMGGHAFADASDPEEALLQQARGYRRTFGEFGLFRRLIRSIGYAFTATHPFLPLRYEWLKDWHDNGYFGELLSAAENERKQIAIELSGDPLMHDIKSAILYEIVDYFEEKYGVARSVSHPLVRKAILLKQQLRNTPLEKLLLVELRVKRVGGDKTEYTLELTMSSEMDASAAIRVRIALGDAVNCDWEYTPKQFRHKMIELRTDEIVCPIYSC